MLVWPQAFGLHAATPFAQVIAFRAVLAFALAAVLAVAVVAAFVRRRTSMLAPIGAGLAVVVALALAADVAVIAVRGSDGRPAEGELAVLSWNTQGGAVSPQAIADAAVEIDADVVALPETDAVAAAEVARILAGRGIRMSTDTVHSRPGEQDIPTSVLIAERLGRYVRDTTVGPTPGLPSGVWRPAESGSGPVLVIAHPFPPLPGGVSDWRAGLEWVAAQCDTGDVVVAGDLNATLDHFGGADALGGCRDAAASVGAAAVGTWPATAPSWLGAPIDHVLAGDAWRVRGFVVLTSRDAAGSDHRPIAAWLDRR